MEEETLWKILEKHYYAAREENYKRLGTFEIPWDECAWMLAFRIDSTNYRAVIERHRTAHIYILKQAPCTDKEPNMPESWFTDWDEGFSMGEFWERKKEE